MGMTGARLLPFLERAYRSLLRVFPQAFRARYEDEMRAAFTAALDAELAERGRAGVLAFALREALDVAAAAMRERRSAAARRDSVGHRARAVLFGCYHDIRTTLRRVYRSAGFAAVTVTTLTLALAVNVVVFSMLHAVRHPILPYAEAERLVVVNEAFPPNGWTQQLTSFPTFQDVQTRVGAFGAVAAYTQRRVSLAVGDGGTRLQAAVISPNLWAVLGVHPALGAGFTTAEAAAGLQAPVVIGDRIWWQFFGGDPNVLGRTAVIDGVAHVIVGVMPSGFRFPEAEDVWLPLTTVDARVLTSRSVRAWQLVGRLRVGASIAVAAEELQVLGDRIAADYPQSNGGWMLTAVPITDESYQATGAFFRALQAGGLLLIALMCSNLANLLLARGEQRRRELAICASLGASRWRLVRLLLVEVLVLACAGVALALLLASWSLRLVPLAIPESIPFYIRFRIDGAVVLFTVALAVGTAVLAGLGAAVRATRGDPHPALAQSAAAVVGPTRNRIRFSFLFVQTAVAAALLGSALVVGFGLIRFQRVDLGFDRTHTLLLEIPLPSASYEDDGRTRAVVHALVEKVASSPDVAAAGVTAPVGMFSSAGEGHGVDIDAGTGATGPAPSTYRAITPEYFRAAGMRLVSGRRFTARDRAGSEDVVIVNTEAARRLFGREPAEGRRVRFGRTADRRRWRTVVGVVANTTEQPLDPEIEPRFYVPFDQEPARGLTLAVRSLGAPEALTRTVAGAVRAVDSSLATEAPTTAERRLAVALWPLRFFAGFAAGFSAFALIVACGGVYGLTRYLTLARTREIALRLALGARLSQVVLMIVRQNGTPVFAGLLLGLAVSVGVSNMLQHVIVGASSFDALALATAAAALAGTAALALGIPALHARRVDPAEALRVS